MRRTQVEFDETTYETLRREARERGVSVSELVEELVRRHLGRPRLPQRVEDLGLVALGRSGQRPGDPLYPISENHDDALAEDFAE